MTNFIYAIWLLFQILTFAIFFRAILSWFVMGSRSPIVATIYNVIGIITEPILAPLRKIIPMVGMMDITPIVAIILLQIISQVLAAYL